MEALLRQATGFSRLLWRPSADMLKEEGYAPAAPPSAAAAEPAVAHADASPELSVGGEVALDTVVLENGLRYYTDPQGQKTGFYADQRDSRLLVRQLAEAASASGRPARVLDLCCYTGGFALCAAAGGASHATGVDSSALALALARRNAALNGLEAVCSFEKEDVGDYMKQASRRATGSRL